MSALLANARSVDIGIIFSWIILLPGLATALIVIAVVWGRGEKAENEEISSRWGPRSSRADD